MSSRLYASSLITLKTRLQEKNIDLEMTDKALGVVSRAWLSKGVWCQTGKARGAALCYQSAVC
jgi:hypothetical protein